MIVCIRCNTPVVFEQVSAGYFAVCPQHYEDLYKFETMSVVADTIETQPKERDKMENNHPVLQQLKDRIAELEAQLLAKTESFDNAIRVRNQEEEQLRELLIEGLTEETIEEATANSIADIFSIELLRNVALSLVFHVEASLQVPYGVDLDELANEVGIETNFTGKAGDYLDYDTWELYDYSVEEA